MSSYCIVNILYVLTFSWLWDTSCRCDVQRVERVTFWRYFPISRFLLFFCTVARMRHLPLSGRKLRRRASCNERGTEIYCGAAGRRLLSMSWSYMARACHGNDYSGVVLSCRSGTNCIRQMGATVLFCSQRAASRCMTPFHTSHITHTLAHKRKLWGYGGMCRPIILLGDAPIGGQCPLITNTFIRQVGRSIHTQKKI